MTGNKLDNFEPHFGKAIKEFYPNSESRFRMKNVVSPSRISLSLLKFVVTEHDVLPMVSIAMYQVVDNGVSNAKNDVGKIYRLTICGLTS